jgi:hypothetical protein
MGMNILRRERGIGDQGVAARDRDEDIKDEAGGAGDP